MGISKRHLKVYLWSLKQEAINHLFIFAFIAHIMQCISLPVLRHVKYVLLMPIILFVLAFWAIEWLCIPFNALDALMDPSKAIRLRKPHSH